jgi:type IV secretory pathway VirB2 component (pilin)
LTLWSAGSAFAATSGTPLDTVATQVMQMVSGPIALLLIIAGFAGAGIIYFLGRNFEVAFVTLAALAIGGLLCSQIQTMATYLFPLAGAVIR